VRLATALKAARAANEADDPFARGPAAPEVVVVAAPGTAEATNEPNESARESAIGTNEPNELAADAAVATNEPNEPAAEAPILTNEPNEPAFEIHAVRNESNPPAGKSPVVTNEPNEPPHDSRDARNEPNERDDRTGRRVPGPLATVMTLVVLLLSACLPALFGASCPNPLMAPDVPWTVSPSKLRVNGQGRAESRPWDGKESRPRMKTKPVVSKSVLNPCLIRG
jgi:hypothetical protein